VNMNGGCDVAIIGGGMTGAALAAALAGGPLRVMVVEAEAFDSPRQVSFDRRTVALTYSSRRIFSAMGAWRRIAQTACPIHRIEVSQRGWPGAAHLHCRDAGTDALGYVAAHRDVGEALRQIITTAGNITVLCPARAQSLSAAADAVTVGGDGALQTLSASLVVIADGGRSSLLDAAGLRRTVKHYRESALVTMVAADRGHRNCAHERFTADGPLALLPAGEAQFAVAWTLPHARAEQHAALDDAGFITVLQETFGHRAGRFHSPKPRHVYPLTLATCTPPARARVALAGNAAHTVHPVAGQGFNLALRDVADLCSVIARAHAAGEDIGGARAMAGYAAARRRDTFAVTTFTDGLVTAFANPAPPAAAARALVLGALNFLPPVRRALLRKTMGLRPGQLWLREFAAGRV